MSTSPLYHPFNGSGRVPQQLMLFSLLHRTGSSSTPLSLSAQSAHSALSAARGDHSAACHVGESMIKPGLYNGGFLNWGFPKGRNLHYITIQDVAGLFRRDTHFKRPNETGRCLGCLHTASGNSYDSESSCPRLTWWTHYWSSRGPNQKIVVPNCFDGDLLFEMSCFVLHIWVWVKIRYPNNWMVNTKLD